MWPILSFLKLDLYIFSIKYPVWFSPQSLPESVPIPWWWVFPVAASTRRLRFCTLWHSTSCEDQIWWRTQKERWVYETLYETIRVLILNQNQTMIGQSHSHYTSLSWSNFLRVSYVIVAKMPTILLWEVRDEGFFPSQLLRGKLHLSLLHDACDTKKIHREISDRLPISPNRRNNIYSHCSNETKEAIFHILLVLHHYTIEAMRFSMLLSKCWPLHHHMTLATIWGHEKMKV